MDTIKTYLDNMFLNLPKTDEINSLKNDLLNNMEDKYNELKAQGKTENESIGIVISEFGNIDELINEMGIKIDEPDENSRILSMEEVRDYLNVKKVTGKNIAIGVLLCILSSASYLISKFLLNHIISDENLANNISCIPFFIFIMIAVALFITSGLKIQKYDDLTKKPFNLTSTTKAFLEKEYDIFRTKFGRSIVTGVLLCIFSVIPPIIADAVTTNEAYIDLISSLLFLFIALGVYQFITVGTIDTSYQQLLKTGDFAPQKIEKNKFLGTIASIFWPLVAGFYLFISFFTNCWSKTWIIWPICGILFGVFSAIYSAISENKNKN